MYCMSEKSWPISYGNLLHRMGHYFLDMQQQETSVRWNNVVFSIYVHNDLCSKIFSFAYTFCLYLHFSFILHHIQRMYTLFIPDVITICLRSLDPIYIVTYYIKWVTTSWTDSITNSNKNTIIFHLNAYWWF